MGDDLGFERTWVLLNKMLPEFVEKFTEFLSVSKFLPPIPWSADVVRAYSKRRLALNLENANQFTLAILQTLNALLPSNAKERLDNWSEERTVALREPIQTQYQDLEQKLAALTKQQIEIDYREMRRKNFTQFSIVLLFLPFIIFVAYLGLVEFQSPAVGQVRDVLWLTLYGLLAAAVLVFVGPRLLYPNIARLLNLKTDSFSERLVEKERLARQLDVTRAKLSELEVLRSADLKDIVLVRDKETIES